MEYKENKCEVKQPNFLQRKVIRFNLDREDSLAFMQQIESALACSEGRFVQFQSSFITFGGVLNFFIKPGEIEMF